MRVVFYDENWEKIKTIFDVEHVSMGKTALFVDNEMYKKDWDFKFFSVYGD